MLIGAWKYEPNCKLSTFFQKGTILKNWRNRPLFLTLLCKSWWFRQILWPYHNRYIIFMTLIWFGIALWKWSNHKDILCMYGKLFHGLSWKKGLICIFQQYHIKTATVQLCIVKLKCNNLRIFSCTVHASFSTYYQQREHD